MFDKIWRNYIMKKRKLLIVFAILLLFGSATYMFKSYLMEKPSGVALAEGTSTESPAATATAGSATDQPRSTDAAEPTATADPSSATPDPTATPEATDAPEPTAVPEATDAPESTDSPEPTPDTTASFTFTASGDDLVHSVLYEQAARRAKGTGKKYDFSYCFKNVKKFFKKQDLNWINQETLVNNGYTPSGYPTFSTPTQVVRDLRKCGFTIFNTSSNHSYDKLSGGLSSAMKFWKAMKKKDESKACYQVGIAKRSKPLPQLIREVNGVRVGFLSYTYGTNGISIAGDSTYRVVYLSEESLIKKQVKALRKKVDVVMVSCHWGVENSHTISASQKALAKKLVSWGADLIIGTHPHVLQDCAWVKAGGRKGFCAYSLGNFISGQVQTNQILGGTLTCEIKVDRKTGKVKIKQPKIKPSVTLYGAGRSNIRVKWLKNYTSADAAEQSSHVSKASFTALAKRVIKAKFLDL